MTGLTDVMWMEIKVLLMSVFLRMMMERNISISKIPQIIL